MPVFVLDGEHAVDAAVRTLHALPLDGSFEVVIQPYTDKQTPAQVRYFHGVVLRDIAEQAWVNKRRFTAETWKEFFKGRFIGEEEIELPSGATHTRALDSSGLSRRQYSTFIEQVKRYALEELGVVFTDNPLHSDGDPHHH